MWDLFGNHIVGFPTRRLICWYDGSSYVCICLKSMTSIEKRLNPITKSFLGQPKETYTKSGNYNIASAAPVAERLRALLLNHSIIGVGSCPALATCETSQVLLADVPGGFSRGSPVFVPPTDWPVSYELK